MHTLLRQDLDKAALHLPVVPHLARLAVAGQRAEGGGGVAGPAPALVPALVPAQLPPEAVLPGDGVHGHTVARGSPSSCPRSARGDWLSGNREVSILMNLKTNFHSSNLNSQR